MKQEVRIAIQDIHRELVDGLRSGDRSAQYEIYKRYHKAMFNTCLRIVGNIHEAEDIMQESFLDAFVKIDQFQGESTFGSWLKRIVINKSLDALRKDKEWMSLEESNIDVPEEKDDYNEEEITYQILEVKNTLNQLPSEYRIILSLYLLEGYDHEEISQILGISYNNARTRYSRAKQKLLSLLAARRRMAGMIRN